MCSRACTHSSEACPLFDAMGKHIHGPSELLGALMSAQPLTANTPLPLALELAALRTNRVRDGLSGPAVAAAASALAAAAEKIAATAAAKAAAKAAEKTAALQPTANEAGAWTKRRG